MAKQNFEDFEYLYMKPDGTMYTQAYMGNENASALMDDIAYRRSEDPHLQIVVTYKGQIQPMGPACKKPAKVILAQLELSKLEKSQEQKLASLREQDTLPHAQD